MKRILIIDDFFGREVPRGRNVERESLCRRLGLVEFGTAPKAASAEEKPLGMVQFFRGQSPLKARVGDVVENDLDACLQLAAKDAPDDAPWDLILLDLCFYTGPVTEESDADFAGFPEGRAEDDDPDCFFGMRVLKALQESLPQLPVVIYSAHSGEKVREQAAWLGAWRFIARDDPNARQAMAEAVTELNARPALSATTPRDLAALLALARSLPPATTAELRNSMSVLKEIEAVLLTRALHGSLTRNRDEAGVALLPAIKLITGQESLTTSQAADWVKRLVHQTRPHEAVLLADPLIKDAYEKSMRLRPGAGKRPDDD